MLAELIAPTIEAVVNKVVKLDPDSHQQLKKLDQKVIAFDFVDIQQKMYFTIDDCYIVVKTETDSEPSAELSGNLLSFFNLAITDDKDPIFKGEVRFSGEISTAQNFQHFFSQLDIDWEEHLSQYIGDIASHHAVTTGRAIKGWLEATFDTATQNFSEYVRFESRAVPASIELENLYDDIADIKADVERFELKVNRLIQRNASSDKA